jgi:hypothetical protein
MRRKTSLLSAASLVVAVLLFAPGDAGASSGTVDGGSYKGVGPEVDGASSSYVGHVDNVSVTLDDCGGCTSPQGASANLEDLQFGCPVGDRGHRLGEPLPFWTSDAVPTTGGTVQSGPLDFPVNPGIDLTLVCLYEHRGFGSYASRSLVGSAPLVFAGSTGSESTGSRAAALKKCKKKFPKGPRRTKCIKKAKKLPV